MSCWSGFWCFVSCHSVMAFPSFTIRWTGAEMLYFHFPRVSNSRWLGEAFSSVLLYEQSTTWSITYSECSSSESLPVWQVPHQLLQCSSGVHVDTHIAPKYVLSHRHMHTRMQTVTEVYKKHLGIFPDTVHEPVLDSLSHFFGKTFLISKCKKKKKKETLYVATSSREEEKSPTSHLVAGDITEIWQEFSGSFLPFLSSGYWSPILGSYLHSGPSPMCNIISSFWEASFWHLNLLFPGG